jgi:uncharacterized membrane protein
MNAAHVHLLLNHVPIVATLMGCLLLAAALMRRSDELVRASFGLLIVAALAVVPVYLSGEPAAEVVEDGPQVSEETIEAHEKAAGVAAVLLGLLGAVALGGLVICRRLPRVPAWLALAALALGLVSATLLARAANLGGQIRHPEIRSQGSPLGEGRASAHPFGH